MKNFPCFLQHKNNSLLYLQKPFGILDIEFHCSLVMSLVHAVVGQTAFDSLKQLNKYWQSMFLTGSEEETYTLQGKRTILLI